MNEDTQKAVRSIVQQWKGGEHRLSGARASELVFGKSNKANQDILEALVEGAPGIEKYIVAPSQPPVDNVPDEGGYPLSNQPEAVALQGEQQNLSSDAAKDEQNAIDDTLAPGREARGDVGDLGSTELNPTGSDEAPETVAKKTKAKKSLADQAHGL